ncbi:AAEL005398-PA, partial [Aedes aegypti]
TLRRQQLVGCARDETQTLNPRVGFVLRGVVLGEEHLHLEHDSDDGGEQELAAGQILENLFGSNQLGKFQQVQECTILHVSLELGVQAEQNSVLVVAVLLQHERNCQKDGLPERPAVGMISQQDADATKQNFALTNTEHWRYFIKAEATHQNFEQFIKRFRFYGWYFLVVLPLSFLLGNPSGFDRRGVLQIFHFQHQLVQSFNVEQNVARLAQT